MTAIYQRIPNSDFIKRIAEGATISFPPDPANTEYAKYLSDVAADPTCVADADPLPVVVPQTISDRQFFQALALNGQITQQEALEAVKVGEIPAAIVTVLDALDGESRFAASMLLSGATVFERNHPMTLLLATALGWSAEQLDALWTSASAL